MKWIINGNEDLLSFYVVDKNIHFDFTKTEKNDFICLKYLSFYDRINFCNELTIQLRRGIGVSKLNDDSLDIIFREKEAILNFWSFINSNAKLEPVYGTEKIFLICEDNVNIQEEDKKEKEPTKMCFVTKKYPNFLDEYIMKCDQSSEMKEDFNNLVSQLDPLLSDIWDESELLRKSFALVEETVDREMEDQKMKEITVKILAAVILEEFDGDLQYNELIDLTIFFVEITFNKDDIDSEKENDYCFKVFTLLCSICNSDFWKPPEDFNSLLLKKIDEVSKETGAKLRNLGIENTTFLNHEMRALFSTKDNYEDKITIIKYCLDNISDKNTEAETAAECIARIFRFNIENINRINNSNSMEKNSLEFEDFVKKTSVDIITNREQTDSAQI